MIWDFILSFLFGLVCHQSKRLTETFPPGWENVSDHSIGGVMLLIAWPWWYFRLHDMPHGFRRGYASLALSLLGTGAGVVAGWVLDGSDK